MQSNTRETRFKELEAFYKKHGKLPSLKDNEKLYHWLKTCRRRLKLQELNPAIESMFEQAGIALQPGKFPHTSWDDTFAELVQFIKNNGRHPLSDHASEKKLYAWINVQKIKYRKGKLSAEKWERLSKLAISQKRKSRSAWVNLFNDLEAYYKEHGKLPSQKDNEKLYFWVINCRNRLKFKKLPHHIKSRFDKAGIDLKPGKGKVDRANWDQMFAELETFVKRHGRYPLYNDPSEKKLYVWLGVQKTAHRRGKLSPEKWERLDTIGISTARIPAPALANKWDMRFKQAEVFFKKNGRLPTKDENKVLYEWLSSYRRKLKLQKLPLEIALRFQSAGIDLRGGKSIKNWSDKFNELKYFIETHRRTPAYNPDERKLYIWLSGQKNKYRKGKLPEDRLRQLTDIGVSLVRKPKQTFTRVSAKIFTYLGEERLNEAGIFYKKHGRLPTQIENKRLYSWLALYRDKLKAKTLRPDILLLFEKAGIDLMLLGQRRKTG